MNDYHFDGDPEVDSTRRQLERLLKGQPSRKWPWVVAALASGAAFTVWRIRARRARSSEHAEETAPHPASGSQHA